MGSTLAAMAMSAFAVGAEAPSSTAQASIPPREAADAVRTYAIPAGSMADALSAFADANGYHLLYDTNLTRTLKTRGLSGRYSPGQGLGLLLSDAGLSYRFVRKGRAVSIVLAQNDTGTQSDAVPLPQVDVEGVGAGSGSGTGEGGPGGPKDPTAYSVPNTSLATKTDTPIMQTPIDVVVVPQQVLRDQQVITIDDALQNVSNVYPLSVGGLQSGFLIRGFENYKYYLDGVRVDNLNTPISEDMADIQQVQVLKGPASILYGRIEPGGLIELDTKKPLSESYHSVQQQIGSYSFYRTTMDMTGPVTADNSVLYRFNAAYENAQSFREFDYNRRIFLSPRIYWAPTEDTQATFYLRYLNGVAPLDLGSPILLNALGNPMGIAPVPISRNYGEPGSQGNTYDVRVGFNWTHAFNPNWSLTQRFDADFRHSPLVALLPYGPLSACGATCPVQRLINNPDNKVRSYYTSLELTGHFNTFDLAHTLLVGGDFYMDRLAVNRSFNFEVPSIDLWNPVHTGLPTYLLSTPNFQYSLDEGQDWYGLYLQDQITLPFNFHLMAGVRYDNASTFSNQIVTVPSPTTINSGRVSDAVAKPRVGLLWQPIPQLSLFGDYVEGFGLSSLLNGDGSPNRSLLAPQQSRQWEAGIKTELLDGRLTSTLAWFDIIKTNIPSPSSDPALAALGVQVATGAVRNTGLDFDISGQVSPEVKIIGSFAFIDSKIIRDNNGNVGNRFYGVPRLGGSLWAVYEPQAELVRGLALGAGFFARSDFEFNNANSFTLPGYTTVNMMARYAFTYDKTKLSFQVNVNNLFDKSYYQVFGGGGNVFPGTPRTILGSLRVEF